MGIYGFGTRSILFYICVGLNHVFLNLRNGTVSLCFYESLVLYNMFTGEITMYEAFVEL